MKKLLIFLILGLMSFGMVQVGREHYTPFRLTHRDKEVKWSQRSIKLDGFDADDGKPREMLIIEDWYWSQHFDGIDGVENSAGYYFVMSDNGIAIFDQSTELDSEGLGEIKFRATAYGKDDQSNLTYTIYVHMDELFGGELTSREITMRGKDRVTIEFNSSGKVYDLTRSKRMDSICDNSPYMSVMPYLIGN